MQRHKFVASIGIAAALATAGIALTSTADAHDYRDRVVLRSADGAEVGTVKFTTTRHHTAVHVVIKKASAAVAADAFHGFHIHANSDPANGVGCIADPAQPSSTWFVSADGHLKQDGQTHGHHDGDMPSLYVNPDGSVSVDFTIDRVPVDQLRGKAVVLHAGADNFGNVPVGDKPDQYTANGTDATTKTANTGNAGDRIACGVIGG